MRVALVVLDTLRKDVFDDLFGWLPGRSFERAFAPSHWTVPVHASLFTGEYPSRLGVHSRYTSLDTEGTTLAERARADGYTTRGFSANANITPHFSFDRGFDEFELGWRAKPFRDDIFDWGSHRPSSSKARRFLTGVTRCLREDYDTIESLRYGFNLERGNEDDGARSALEWLRAIEFDDDEFLFLNLMEAHGPYYPPESYRQTSDVAVDGLRDTIRGADYPDAFSAYRDCVRYLADTYREMFGVLERAGFDLIITCSDHGELFGEHGGVWQHDYGVYPELTHVPLHVAGQAAERVGNVESTVSLLDVHATLADAMGTSRRGRGRSLFSSGCSREQVFTEYHGIPLRGKYEGLVEEFGQEMIDGYDEPLVGMATRDEYYWEERERRGADVVSGPKQEVFTERIAQMKESLKSATGQTAVPEGLQSQLEDLGYM